METCRVSMVPKVCSCWVLVLGAFACSERALQPLPSSQGESGGSGGLGSAAGGASSATGGGGSSAGTAGNSGGAGVSGSGGSSAGSGGIQTGPATCTPACAGATPTCDTSTLTCKTCTTSEGCSGETPLCDAAAAGGLGECKPIEVLAIYTLNNPDLAHVSYVTEANEWFPSVAAANHFTYQATTDWEILKTVTPAVGRVVLFLDDKPDDATQRAAFEAYMEGGGAWLGCHFAAYTPDAAEWDWYFNQFLGSGDYNGNTWRPTSAALKVEASAHPVAQGLGTLFTAAPNEWYRFMTDLRSLPNFEVVLSIDPSSFPLGTGPKPEEIWHEGDYPVVWRNTDYKMLYVNMGHDDMDYGGTNQALSSTFSSPMQNQMLLNAIHWLGAASD
jgi:uncharacterized protein